MLKLILGALVAVCVNQVCVMCLPSLEEPADETGCVCVPFYLCEEDEIITDGAGLLDPRKKPPKPTELGIDEKYIPPVCGDYHVCCGKPSGREVTTYVHRCGARNPNGVHSRITTTLGEAEIGEWPYQAAILLSNGDDVTFKCGGTIIDDYHILTIAHCVDKLEGNEQNIVVRLGLYDVKSNDEQYPYEDYGVDQMVLHEDYRPSNLHNDIALLKLDRQIQFQPHIDSICLPRVNDDFAGKTCVVTGWGKKGWDSGTYSAILKEVTVPVISNDDCQHKLRNTRLGKHFKLHSGFICAGGKEGEDSCKGDGGGPLFCYGEDGRYHLAGIVSWGIQCGKADYPGVYVKVQMYLDWIMKYTERPLDSYYE